MVLLITTGQGRLHYQTNLVIFCHQGFLLCQKIILILLLIIIIITTTTIITASICWWCPKSIEKEAIHHLATSSIFKARRPTNTVKTLITMHKFEYEVH